MGKETRIRDFDYWLLFLALLICGLGVLEIYSATRNGSLAGMHWRQLWWIALGILCMLMLARVDYHKILDHAPLLYLAGLAGLVAVLLVGHTRFGARRWLPVGSLLLQVSELMKLIIIIALARFFSEIRTDRLTLVDLAKAGLLTAVPVGLILLQPDLGSAVVLVAVAVGGAFVTGIQWKHAVTVALLGMLLFPAGWLVLKPYQKERIETFLRPEENPRGPGYQVLQSKIAVGSGGLLGKGIGKGSQNQLGFVPVRWADFILAAVAEELGFVGVFVTLTLYVALLLRLVQNAQSANDRAGTYLVLGVAAALGFHVFVNVAMVIGYMPVTGIPLPLMSYGGSATLFTFMALGLATNVRSRRFVN